MAVGLLVNERGIPRRGHGDGDGEHRRRPVPDDAVQALVPLVGLDVESLDVGADVIEQRRFFLQGQPGDEVFHAGFEGLGGVHEQIHRAGGDGKGTRE